MSASEPLSREATSVSLATGARIAVAPLPRLYAGDHLDQPTFHARYEAMPKSFRAELIEGVVIVSSPATTDHAEPLLLVATWVGTYHIATAGTKAGEGPTAILGKHSEPQPDVALWIGSDCGGQTSEQDGYLVGAPELVVECAFSSESHDMHSKRRDYERAGVKEYVVVLLRERRVAWFVLREGRFISHEPDADGILRSTVFPGLWLDPLALLADDGVRVLQTLQQGIASPQHKAFVERLQAERARLAGEAE